MPAVVDTGFSAYLTLPLSLIEQLSLKRTGTMPIYLADGSRREADLYEANVNFNGRWTRVEVENTDGECLLGMDMLYGYQICIDAIEQCGVTIEALE